MSKNRDTVEDKRVTREMILDPNRPKYTGGVNWLGHGGRGGKDAVIDYLLLDGATMERLLKERNTVKSVRTHFQYLRIDSDLFVRKGSDGKYRFDRQHLGIKDSDLKPNRVKLATRSPTKRILKTEFCEGAAHTVEVTLFQRDPDARRRCIEYYGAKCAICEFEFGSIFGSTAEGFIHVHHINPLATIRAEYRVDPINDLRPVCPNCHAMIHLGDGCLSIEEVKGRYNSEH